MGLNSFTITKERCLPVFILADTSGSMSGEKIQAVNNAIREMISALRKVTEVRGVFKICIITFGSESVTIQQPLTNVNEIEFKELIAAGKTPMGQALTLVAKLIEDVTIIKASDYSPTVILLSDGYPTDYSGGSNASLEEYLAWEPIKVIHNGVRCKKCMRIAISVDTATDLTMLKAFLDNGTNPMMANDASSIEKVFQYVTMTTITRMTSRNPDDINSFLRFKSSDDEVVI